jgi:hypothetical protein
MAAGSLLGSLLGSLRGSLRRVAKRPFANAHWSLLVGLIIAFDVGMLGSACSQTHVLEVALCTFTLCVALWCNHLRLAPIRTWKLFSLVVLGALRDLVLFALLWVVCAIPLMVLIAPYSCYGGRALVGELLGAADPLKRQIAERIEESQTVKGSGAGLSMRVAGAMQAVVITDDGVIILAELNAQAIVVLEPRLVDGAVSWQCTGYPARNVPAQCRRVG